VTTGTSKRRVVDVGHRPDPRRFGPVTQTDIVRFAGAGGDFNPLHHDPDAAAAAGFTRPIAMGQLTAGLLAGWVTDSFGVENLRRLEVRFSAPLAIGDEVSLEGEVVAIEEHQDETRATREIRATLEIRATRDGAPLVSGAAVVAVG
jgi:3-hydroxybutyryl-CoA dehydratase